MVKQDGPSLFYLSLLVLINHIKFGSARGVAIVAGSVAAKQNTRNQSGSAGGKAK